MAGQNIKEEPLSAFRFYHTHTCYLLGFKDWQAACPISKSKTTGTFAIQIDHEWTYCSEEEALLYFLSIGGTHEIFEEFTKLTGRSFYD